MKLRRLMNAIIVMGMIILLLTAGYSNEAFGAVHPDSATVSEDTSDASSAIVASQTNNDMDHILWVGISFLGIMGLGCCMWFLNEDRSDKKES